MTAPEYIWAWTWNHKFPSKQNGTTQWNASIYPSDPEHCATEYRRADLPPTLSAALAMPEVRALVAASKGLLFAHDHGNGLEGWHNTRERMRAALSAIGEGVE